MSFFKIFLIIAACNLFSAGSAIFFYAQATEGYKNKALDIPNCVKDVPERKRTKVASL